MKKMVISIFIFFIFFINLCKTNNNVSFNCVEYCLEENIIDIQISYVEKTSYVKKNVLMTVYHYVYLILKKIIILIKQKQIYKYAKKFVINDFL